ncbi:RICIN domain-containing protein [Actinocrinis puniceicyclus]|uniref:RICIN domain-containing protein n=1 Tax=Actinocrinis puniceicyclus TaxID=977794 RepID=A0A8J7WVD7_9ACTN|nr:RICIN domain-containing protein [Actinocrinis puniceicyclus]MBS2966525.1 RICIN domain-containing protein [Actinocrinis puniceicyclus]
MRKILSGRGALRAGAAALTASAVLGASVGAAHASAGASYTSGGYTVYQSSQAKWITAEHDGMNVAVADNGTDAGHRVVQWYNDGGAEQKWYFDQVYDSTSGFEGYLLRNQNSGLCLSTDGNAGDTLFQDYCNPANGAEWFTVGTSGADNRIFNRYTGLYLDVSGYSYAAGANMDLWYWNGDSNQWFWIDNA